MSCKHITIPYDFYKEYVRENPLFQERMNQRIVYVRAKHQLKGQEEDAFIQEYFVEVFSWTVLSYPLLLEMDALLSSHVPNYTLVDPCSGNSFHTFLFRHFCDRSVMTVDIQPDEVPWTPTIEADGIAYVQRLASHQNLVLFLSWVDFTDRDIVYQLLTSFHGKIVVSVGNYRNETSQKYLERLRDAYQLLATYFCVMPWGLTEEIRIFKIITE